MHPALIFCRNRLAEYRFYEKIEKSAAIKSGESYGYQMIKDMKPYLEMSESTLYTILKRLEGAEMLTVQSAEHGGRLRKYYHITGLGLRRIEEFLEEWKESMSIYRFITGEGEVR